MVQRSCGVGNGACRARAGKRPLEAAWPTAALIVAAVSHPTHRLSLCHGHAPPDGFRLRSTHSARPRACAMTTRRTSSSVCC